MDERCAFERVGPVGGFTLVEVLVALAVLTTGALSMAALAADTARRVSVARQHGVAAALADGVLAQLQQRDLAATPPGCLTRDIDGCVIFYDAVGQPSRDPRAPFAVRWSATSLFTVPRATMIVACAVPVSERQPTPDRPPSTALPRTCVARLAVAGVP